MRTGQRLGTSRGGTAVAAIAAVAIMATAASSQAHGEPARTAHVIVVSVDGLRPDAIEAFDPRTIRMLMAAGGHSPDANTVVPSQTLPSHTSMLTGVGPAVHGITWNRYRPEAGPVAVPTIFELARSDGHHVAAFYAKAKFRQLDRPGSYDHRLVPRWRVDHWMSTDVVQEAVQYLAHRRPNLLFIHIPEPDYAGHAAGWMGTVYRLAVSRADAAVGEVLDAARTAFGQDGFVLIVTADHGGHERTHGTDDPRSVRIPWIVYGQGVAPGQLLPGVRTTDTAATVLWLLGVARPAWFQGRPVAEAFLGPDLPVTSGRGSP
jgi:predicted AlkP superfamily pyrophosphatase or phosphodiesterase